MKSIKYIASVLLVLGLSACSGGGGSSTPSTATVTGTFIDDPVQGLNYSCSAGTTGVTNASGEYTCNVGDNVTFRLGNISLGTISAQTTAITPYVLFPTNTTAAINLARLLQSIDTGAVNGSIVINSTHAANIPANTDFTNASFETATETALGITLVSAYEAQSRMDTGITTGGGTVPTDRNHVPVANAGVDQNITTASIVTLNGSSSADSDFDFLTYSWNFVSKPNGSTAILLDTTTVNPTFTADINGTYILELIVHDGSIDSASDAVTVTATEPSAGTLDTNFGTNGLVSTDFTHKIISIVDIFVDLNNSIYTFAQTYDGYDSRLIDSNITYLLVTKYTASGDLDETFGNSGLSQIELLTNKHKIYDVIMLDSGKFLITGSYITEFFVARFNRDASLDTTFGVNGYVQTNVRGDVTADNYSPSVSADMIGARSIKLQSDGKIIVGGSSIVNNRYVFAMVRYSENGSIDTTFGINGIVTTDIPNNDVGGSIFDIEIQSDDKIIAGGGYSDIANGYNEYFTVVRYLPNGSLDTTFATDGIYSGWRRDAVVKSIFLQEDGKILIVGPNSVSYTYSNIITKLNSDGSRDNSFGSSGTIDAGFYNSKDIVFHDNKIIINGFVSSGLESYVLKRFNQDGSLDIAFENFGVITSQYNIAKFAIQLDNKIITISGSERDSNSSVVRLSRYYN